MVYIAWICFFMFIWFETDFFPWWAKLFRMGKFLKVDQWESYKESSPRISYINYLFIQYPNFYTKLISCRSCLLFWISLVFSLLGGSIWIFPFYYFSSYVIYSILNKIIKWK